MRLHRIRAFTQVEVLMTLAILGLACVIGTEALRQNLWTFRRIVDHIDRQSAQSAALALLRQDLRSATLREAEFRFIGNETTLNFFRTGNLPGIFWEVGYRVESDPGSGDRRLVRRLHGEEAVVATNIEEFEFNYFDGSCWLKTWEWDGGIRGLPLAVRFQSKTTDAIFPVMVSIINKRRTL